MLTDETEQLVMSTFRQVARADKNATVLRGFAIAALAIAFVLAFFILIAVGESLGGADAGQAELRVLLMSLLGILFLGFFLWALLEAFANLVSNGARALMIRNINFSLAMGGSAFDSLEAQRNALDSPEAQRE